MPKLRETYEGKWKILERGIRDGYSDTTAWTAGGPIVSPRLEKPENPKCRKCGRIMRSHGSYRRKSDGVTVKRYYCPNCRITLQAPIRSKKKRRASKHPLIFLDKILGFLSLIKQCPYCG